MSFSGIPVALETISRGSHANSELSIAQSLKETFAEKIPGEIEKVKKLRKYVVVHKHIHRHIASGSCGD
jgi:3-polyprenyl-4-hydroxybenzoate decarboxylase